MPGSIIAFPTKLTTAADTYTGWQLTHYRRHFARDRGGEPIIGEIVYAATADELLDGYALPMWLDGEVPTGAKQVKDAAPCVTAALMNGARSHANAGLARVLFVDFDKSADGTEGLRSEECACIAGAMQAMRRVFLLHTTSSTPWLSEGRAKLRLLMPLLEPVHAEGYGRLWNLVAEYVREHAGVQADGTKRHPGDLLYRPVFHRTHAERWSSLRSPASVESLLWDVPTASMGDAYERVRVAVAKNDALFRAAYGLGRQWARENIAGDAEQALSERVWPRLREALQSNTASEPVKDWTAAETTARRKFLLAVEDERQEESSAAGEYRRELLRECRTSIGAAELEAIAQANGRTYKPLCGLLTRGARLVASDIGMTTEERTALANRVNRAIGQNYNAHARPQLEQAWTTGEQEGPLDVVAEYRQAQQRAREVSSWRDLGLVINSKTHVPEVNATNLVRLFAADKALQGVFARNCRSESEEVVVLREWRGLHAGQRVELRHSQQYRLIADYCEQERQMPGLLVEDFDRAIDRVIAELPQVDPIIDYLEALAPATTDGTEQLESFFVRHGGAEDTRVTRAVTRAMFLSAVRTCFEPGARQNSMWLLMGPQGIGKTQLLQTLVPAERYFGTIESDEIAGGPTSDAGRKPRLTASRCLLVEVPEIYLAGKAVTAWKSFISDFMPVFRRSFARVEQVFPRRGILVATSNEEQVLKDQSGNRRFLPLLLRKRIDLVAVARERESLWSTALSLYRRGESSDVPESLWEELAGQQEDHRAVSSLEEKLAGLTSGSMAWPVPDQPGAYESVQGLRTEWLPVVCKSATGGDIPRCLKLNQLADILHTRNTRLLTSTLGKLGWKYRRSREFFTNGELSRMWIHPASVPLLKS